MSARPVPRSIAQLSVLIQSGALDPRDLVAETFEAIHAHADQSIFIRLTQDRARREAEASALRIREGRSLGALDGIPIGWKDLFDMEGMPTPAGSVVLADAAPAERDAAVVAHLALAGMVSIGRLNMSEFAFSGLGINPHYGTPANPRSMDGHRLPGGSSSGSAVAVATGLVPVAMGTDTGGSIRIPAAFNGIVGYKATRGRYAMEGVFPLATSLDSLGPLTRTVPDAVMIDSAMRGRTAPDIAAADFAGQVIVVPETVFFDAIEPGIAAAFEAGLSRLERAGARIHRQAFPEIVEIFDLMAEHGPLVTAEAFALHRQRLSSGAADRMDPRVVARCRMGEKTGMPAYIALLDARTRLIRTFNAAIGDRAVIATPTLPHVAPLTEPLEKDFDAFVKMNGFTLRNTLIGNFLDWCGVSLPCGTGAHGLPAGLLISGLPHQDEQVLSLALTAERLLEGL